MTEAQKQARSLIDQFGEVGALSHVNFVLDPCFGLSKSWQIHFWYQVRIHVKEYMGLPATVPPEQKILQK